MYINILLIEVVKKIPKYAKFIKKILFNKKKWEEQEIVLLTKECSATIQKKLPPKLKDPESFMIPCTIGSSYVVQILCDLWENFNLMPITVSLQFMDISILHLLGINEDVLVKVDKLIFFSEFHCARHGGGG